MFMTERVVEFGMCDAAGILFYPKIFELAHSVYEEFILTFGEDYFQHKTFAVPIVNASAEFFNPVTLHENLAIRISLIQLGKSSFELETEFWGEEDKKAIVKTTHVFVNKKNFSSVEIPKSFRELLKEQSEEY